MAREAVYLTQSELGEKLAPPMSDENIGRIERSHAAGILSKRVPQLAAALKMPLELFQRELIAPAGKKTAARLTLSEALSEKVRRHASDNGKEPEAWLAWAVDFVTAAPSDRRQGVAPKGGRLPRRAGKTEARANG